MDQWITCFTDSGVYPACSDNQPLARFTDKPGCRAEEAKPELVKKPDRVKAKGDVSARPENKREALSS